MLSGLTPVAFASDPVRSRLLLVRCIMRIMNPGTYSKVKRFLRFVIIGACQHPRHLFS
jgi:hypothetical protein